MVKFIGLYSQPLKEAPQVVRPKLRRNVRGRPAVKPFLLHNRRFEAAFDRKSSVQPCAIGTTRYAQCLRVVAVAAA
jgi:hypothetical protein